MFGRGKERFSKGGKEELKGGKKVSYRNVERKCALEENRWYSLQVERPQ